MFPFLDGKTITSRDDDYDECPIYHTNVQVNSSLERHPGRPRRRKYNDPRRPPPPPPRKGGVELICLSGETHYDGHGIFITPRQTAIRTKDMLLTQPPITSLSYLWDEDDSVETELMYRAEGIRLGHLMDLQTEVVVAYASHHGLHGADVPVQCWRFWYCDDDGAKADMEVQWRKGEQEEGPKSAEREEATQVPALNPT